MMTHPMDAGVARDMTVDAGGQNRPEFDAGTVPTDFGPAERTDGAYHLRRMAAPPLSLQPVARAI